MREKNYKKLKICLSVKCSNANRFSVRGMFRVRG